MKKFILILIVGLLSAFFAQSQTKLFVNQPPDSAVRLDPQMQRYSFKPGEILVRYRDEAVVENLRDGNLVQTGLSGIDRIFSEFKVTRSEPLFPGEKRKNSTITLKDFTGRSFDQPGLHNIFKIRVPDDRSVFDAIDELMKDPDVIYAEPNYLLSITGETPVSPVMTDKGLDGNGSPKNGMWIPNDPLYAQQWYIPAVHANEIWDTITNDSAQVIGVLDTGVDWLHPDLSPRIWINPEEIPENGVDDDGNGKIDDVHGWDFVNSDNNPTDDNSHGTHVAGIAAAMQNNGIGIAGVSRKARIMPIKVFQSSGQGDAATITQGIIYAVNNGATILNMSFGSYGRSLTMEAALANAYPTCVLVAAAGNNKQSIYDQPPGPFFPAALSYVLGTQSPDGSFSNFDPDGPVYSAYPDLLNYEMKAPGTNILSTVPNGGYRVYNGTSMAAPVISGCMAMYRSLFPGQSQEIMFSRLIPSTATFLNIHQAIHSNPLPQLWVLSHTIADTLAGDDGDGRVDAGETIQLWLEVRNTGGAEDSVYVGFRYREFEDTTNAQILYPQHLLGSMSSYSTMTNQLNPFVIHFDADIINRKQIVFQALTWYKNGPDTISQDIVVTVENGEELQGILSDTLVLTPDKLWLVNGSFKISPTGVMIIKPGTHLEINNTQTGMLNDGTIIGHGTADSVIYITGTSIHSSAEYGTPIGRLDFDHINMQFINIYNGYWEIGGQSSVLIKNSLIRLNGGRGALGENYSFIDCDFKDWYCYQAFGGNNLSFNRCNFSNVYAAIGGIFAITNSNIKHCTFSKYPQLREFAWINVQMTGCNILDRSEDIAIRAWPGYYQYMQNLYWGTSDSLKISKKIFDFYEDPNLSMIVFWPYQTVPNDSAHGFVWKIFVNGKDAQDETPDPVGIGPQKFEVWFNKPMDPAFTPQVSFGVTIPYNQQAVADSGRWSPDFRKYTVYKTVELYTGDGINRIRVAAAKDTDGWEIPVEDERFEFNIQAAGSASTEFMAVAGIGKVYLEWNNTGIPDLLGFNLYRFNKINDTTHTLPVMINPALLLDTTFTDFNVTPGIPYYYFYRIVNTDFTESDSSTIVSAIPYTATPGDANGDLAVNVLDVTAVIAFMLNQDPQPFLFEAADVKDDNLINILDVIGIVDIILGKDKSFTIPGNNPKPAYIAMEGEKITLKSDGQVAALQFELAGENTECLKLTTPLQGFELAYGTVNGKMLAILYNTRNMIIPAGLTGIAEIHDRTSDLHWGDALGGDPGGNRVAILKNEPVVTAANMVFRAFPNPFMETVTLSYTLETRAAVMISVYDLHGKIVRRYEVQDNGTGGQFVEWNGCDEKGNQLPSGIYFARIEALAPDGTRITGNTKIVLVK